jgi:hypothetical protein
MADLSSCAQLPTSALYRFSSDYSRLEPQDGACGLPILVKVPGSKPACYKAQDCPALSDLEFLSYGSVNTIYESVYPKDDAALRKWTTDVGGPVEAKRLLNEVTTAGKLVDDIVTKHDQGLPMPPISSRYAGYCQSLDSLLKEFKQPVTLTQGLIVNFQLGVFGIIDRIGAYRDYDCALIDIKTALSPKANVKWIEDKVLQVAAYELINDGLYTIDTVGLVFFIRDGSVDEYFFDENQIRPYQEKWLNRLAEVRQIRSFPLAA